MNRTEDGQGVVLAADTAEIGGSVLLRNGFTAEGAISLRGARIGSSLECDGASLTNATADGGGIALAADHAIIGGAVLLRNGFAAQGAISLIGARIGGNLECDGASLTNATPDGTGVALAAENAVIGGAVLLRHGFVAHGGVSLLGATIDSNVECCGAVAGELVGNGLARDVAADQCRDRRRRAAEPGLHQPRAMSACGAPRSAATSTARRATFIGPSPVAAGRSMAGAMVATNLAVAGDMKLIDVTVLGRIDCENLQTGGSLIWDGLRFPREVDRRRRTASATAPGVDALPRMLLSHARIGAALMARDLTAEVALAIDLGGARAGTLDDDGFPGRLGRGPGAGRDCSARLNLDGFVYDRFGHLPSDEASGLGVALSALGRWAAHLDRGHSAVLGGSPGAPHAACAAGACETAPGVGAAPAEQRQRVPSAAVPAPGQGAARAGPLPGGPRGRHRRAVGDAVGQPGVAHAAIGLGCVLRLRPVAGAGDGDRWRCCWRSAPAVSGGPGSRPTCWSINYSYAMTEVARRRRCSCAPEGARPRRARRPAATTTSSRCSTPWT